MFSRYYFLVDNTRIAVEGTLIRSHYGTDNDNEHSSALSNKNPKMEASVHFIWTLVSDLFGGQVSIHLNTGIRLYWAPVSQIFGRRRSIQSDASFQNIWTTASIIIGRAFPNVLKSGNWRPKSTPISSTRGRIIRGIRHELKDVFRFALYHV